MQSRAHEQKAAPWPADAEGMSWKEGPSALAAEEGIAHRRSYDMGSG